MSEIQLRPRPALVTTSTVPAPSASRDGAPLARPRHAPPASGTETSAAAEDPRSPRRLAQALLEATRGPRIDADCVLELCFGLRLEARRATAVEYARLRAAEGDSTFRRLVAALDAGEAGGTEAAEKAVAALYAAFVAHLRRGVAGPLGTGRAGTLLEAQLATDNPSGEPGPDDLVYLDVEGLLGRSGDLLLRLLEAAPAETLTALDARLRERHGLSLADAAGRVRGAEGDRARFLVGAPRRGGRLEPGAAAAFELRRAARSGDREQLFARLEVMSERELREAARSFHSVYSEEGRPGGDGEAGSLGASALYLSLRAAVHDPVGSGADERRLELVFGAVEPRLEGGGGAAGRDGPVDPAPCGLRFDPDPRWTPAERAAREQRQRDLVARYVAWSRAAPRAVHSLVTPELSAPLATGLPTAGEVEAAYAALHASDRRFHGTSFVLDLERAAGADRPEVKALVSGRRASAAAVAAFEVVRALSRSRFGFGAPREDEVVRAILSLAPVSRSPAGSTAFTPVVSEAALAELRREYAALTAGPPGALGRDLAAAFPAARLGGGRALEALPVLLEARGRISPAERLVHALHRPGLFGLLDRRELGEVVALLAGLSPQERAAACNEYARLTGRSGGRSGVSGATGGVGPLGEVGAVGAAGGAGSLGEVEAVGATGVVPGPSPLVADLLREGSADAALAAALVSPPEQRGAALQASASAARGHLLGEGVMDLLGPEAAGLENASRSAGAAVRDLTVLERDRTSSVADRRQAALRVEAALEEMRLRLSAYEQVRDARADAASGIAWTLGLGAALVLAPELGPVALGSLGATSGAAVAGAFGEDAAHVLGRTVRGAATGVLAGGAAGILRAAPAPGSVPGRAVAGALAAAELDAGSRAAAVLTEEEAWRDGPAAAVDRAADSALRPRALATDLALGAAATALVDAAARRLGGAGSGQAAGAGAGVPGGSGAGGGAPGGGVAGGVPGGAGAGGGAPGGGAGGAVPGGGGGVGGGGGGGGMPGGGGAGGAVPGGGPVVGPDVGAAGAPAAGRVVVAPIVPPLARAATPGGSGEPGTPGPSGPERGDGVPPAAPAGPPASAPHLEHATLLALLTPELAREARRQEAAGSDALLDEVAAALVRVAARFGLTDDGLRRASVGELHGLLRTYQHAVNAERRQSVLPEDGAIGREVLAAGD